MSLKVRYVQRFEDVLEPAKQFLSQPYDLFAQPRIVVPNAGAKAWLRRELAKTLGAERGGDGIVANVEVSYPGAILGLLQPQRSGDPDPWDFDRLTFAVLDVLSSSEAKGLKIPFDLDRDPLLTARRIAGLFDEYHVRRPGMIREWDSETPSRHMQPTANDEQKGDMPIPDLIQDQDSWQYELWRLLRGRVGQDSPPRRASIAHRKPQAPLLVAGLESLSWPQLEALQSLASECSVEALLVHPSPGLRSEWEKIGPRPLEAKLRGRPLRRTSRKSEAEAAETDELALPADIDPLPATWLAGSRELQALITSQGVEVLPAADKPAAAGGSLLSRMQATIASGRLTDGGSHDPAHDHSVTIHRCHSLSRQAEVVHEAILHAFADPALKGLNPHDIVIVSPCLDEAAPHLEAVFQRTVVGTDRNGKAAEISLPLVVADRGLQVTNEGVDLLSRLLGLLGSRCGVDDVLVVAGHPLVRPHFGIDDDTIGMWQHLLERTQVRWGLDHAHRTRCGLVIADPSLRDVHTWKSGVEQMLLGAALPDETPRRELGGVVPLADLDPADIGKITKLIRLLGVVGELSTRAASPRSAASWSDEIETALTALCGERCRGLAEPLAQLRRLRDAATGAAANRVVACDEIRTLLAEWFDEKSGRQPLSTGAITATSMVPLRGVPFRVVCVIGYDDTAFGATDPSKDDLVARMPLVGDADPRWETRRGLLDCLLAARDRLVIVCTGRDVKSNEVVPLVTPLAELADFAVRHGVSRGKATGPTAIEIDHPRHHLGRKNFLEGQVQPGITWSHDATALEVASKVSRVADDRKAPAVVKQEQVPGTAAVGGSQTSSAAEPQAKAAEKPEIDIAVLEHFVRDPLGLFLKRTLDINTYRDDDAAIPATLPLTLGKKAVRALTLDLLSAIIADPECLPEWQEAKLRSGLLPPGPHGMEQLQEIVFLAQGLRKGLADAQLDYAARVATSLGVVDLEHFVLVGNLQDVEPNGRQLLCVTAAEISTGTYGRPVHAAAVKLLAARAAGIGVTQATIISRRNEWKPGKKSPAKAEPDRLMKPWQSRVVRLAEELDTPQAARRRLCDIAALVLESLSAPRPTFGKVITSDPDKRLENFDAHVTADFYPRTTECMVFGKAPVFDAVFPPGSRRAQFLSDFQRLMSPPYKGSKQGYRLS